MSSLIEFEEKHWKKGQTLICGIDEAGRGALCLPVLAAAVILPPNLIFEGVQDSKTLSSSKRDELYHIIYKRAISVGVGAVCEAEIDKIGIKLATRMAMSLAVNALNIDPEHLLVDAEVLRSQIPQTSIIKGDRLSQSIAAASIIAKVTRDRLCDLWDKVYPDYGLAKHKGYGTKEHIKNIVDLGATPIHRKTFIVKPLARSKQISFQ